MERNNLILKTKFKFSSKHSINFLSFFLLKKLPDEGWTWTKFGDCHWSTLKVYLQLTVATSRATRMITLRDILTICRVSFQPKNIYGRRYQLSSLINEVFNPYKKRDHITIRIEDFINNLFFLLSVLRTAEIFPLIVKRGNSSQSNLSYRTSDNDIAYELHSSKQTFASWFYFNLNFDYISRDITNPDHRNFYIKVSIVQNICLLSSMFR